MLHHYYNRNHFLLSDTNHQSVLFFRSAFGSSRAKFFKSSKFQVSSFKFQVSSSKFQVPSFKFQVPSSKFQVPDKILESLVTGTKAVTSRYLNTTVSNSSCHQASYTNSQLRTAIHLIAYPGE